MGDDALGHGYELCLNTNGRHGSAGNECAQVPGLRTVSGVQACHLAFVLHADEQRSALVVRQTYYDLNQIRV